MRSRPSGTNRNNSGPFCAIAYQTVKTVRHPAPPLRARILRPARKNFQKQFFVCEILGRSGGRGKPFFKCRGYGNPRYTCVANLNANSSKITRFLQLLKNSGKQKRPSIAKWSASAELAGKPLPKIFKVPYVPIPPSGRKGIQ